MIVNTYPETQLVSSTGTRTPDFNWEGIWVGDLWDGAVLVVSQMPATRANVGGVVDHVDWSGRSPYIVFKDGTRRRVAKGAKMCVGKRYGKKAGWLTAEDVA